MVMVYGALQVHQGMNIKPTCCSPLQKKMMTMMIHVDDDDTSMMKNVELHSILTFFLGHSFNF
jgi:hypothetical protein